MESFIIEFQIKVNKVKASGTTLPDGVLGYALLNAANFSEDKKSMVKATCDELTYKIVKRQLEKIGLTGSDAQKLKDGYKVDTSKVKVESYYTNTPRQDQHAPYIDYKDQSSSDEDMNGERVFYTQGKQSYRGQGSSSRQRNQSYSGQRLGNQPQLNPTDRFGHVRACAFCKCLYHWLVDCPYAPAEVKSGMKSNEKLRSSNKHL